MAVASMDYSLFNEGLVRAVDEGTLNEIDLDGFSVLDFAALTG